jgi:hypothetical protein
VPQELAARTMLLLVIWLLLLIVVYGYLHYRLGENKFTDYDLARV